MTWKEIEEIVAKAKESNKRIDLTGADLSGTDLDSINFHDALLREADLSDAKLSQADLSGADLRGTNLNHANLFGANLRCANLGGAELSYADLSTATLYGAHLNYAELNYTVLHNANLYNANLYGASLCGADLRGVNLSTANLSRADLRYTNLYNTNLNGADLYSTVLSAEYAWDWARNHRLIIRPVGGRTLCLGSRAKDCIYTHVANDYKVGYLYCTRWFSRCPSTDDHLGLHITDGPKTVDMLVAFWLDEAIVVNGRCRVPRFRTVKDEQEFYNLTPEDMEPDDKTITLPRDEDLGLGGNNIDRQNRDVGSVVENTGYKEAETT